MFFLEVWFLALYHFIYPMRISHNVSSPHSLFILSIICGNLLGGAHAERRSFQTKNGLKFGNTRFSFKQGSSNVQYLLHNWKILSSHGYCSNQKPVLKKLISQNNKVSFHIKFNTYTSPFFNQIHEAFYINRVKRVPDNKFLNLYLTPLALATWIIDQGSKEKNAGLLIHTNSFTHEDVIRLCLFLKARYHLDARPRIKKVTLIYIPKNNIIKVRKIVAKYFSRDMMRKLYDS